MAGVLRAAFLAALFACAVLVANTASAADINLVDPTPIAEQPPSVSEGFNVRVSAIAGVQGGNSNHMLLASVSTPLVFTGFGGQIDLGIGKYSHDYTSAAAALHLYWKDPSVGLIGVYGDWGYISPEHGGRMGVQGAAYGDRWTIEAFAGVQFGQNHIPHFVDEIDFSYYFTDNFKGSVGHRKIARGHVANIGFEFQPEGFSGFSLYGEAETGEDGYHGVWGGVRYAIGANSAGTLIERDRNAGARIRIPRNIASITQCGRIPDPANFFDSWNGFETTPSNRLCADEDELNSRGAVIEKAN